MKKRQIFSILLLLPVFLYGQEKDSLWLDDEWYYPETDSHPLIDFTDFLPPFFRDEVLLKRYIRDDRFFKLRKLRNDTLAVDAIFDQAMIMADGDVGHALWISSFAVMDHQSLGLRIPLLGPLFVPLTTENDSTFRARRTNLPKKVLDDDLKASDKDKLQHFFGSALITYITNSESIAGWLGDFFEKNERALVFGGRFDERDRLANKKGREFGLRLLDDDSVLPSDVLWKEKQ